MARPSFCLSSTLRQRGKFVNMRLEGFPAGCLLFFGDSTAHERPFVTYTIKHD